MTPGASLAFFFALVIEATLLATVVFFAAMSPPENFPKQTGGHETGFALLHRPA